MEPADNDASPHVIGPLPTAGTPPVNAAREVLGALPILSRVVWFALGALLATLVTLLAVAKPWARTRQNDVALPYEIFPFTDNAGVCQEYVAIASVQSSHEEAIATVRRVTPLLPAGVRADNLRIVRAFASGDRWTIAVDAQSGSGDLQRATAVAAEMNAVAAMGMRFEPMFYSARRLYDTAGLLCMPRQGVAAR